MKSYYKLFNLKGLLSGFGALLLLASCSSYQYAGYDNDGIYSSSDEGEAYTANDYDESYENALYYKQLFAEKSEQFANIPEEGAIFTDIEGYSSAGQYEENSFGEEGLDYQPGRAAWGTDPDEISINIYNDPFYYPYYSPYYAGFYDPFWGPYPYYGRYGYRPYGYGYYSPWRWNVGFSFGWSNWGYGYYDPFYYPYYRPYYYGGRYYPYSRLRDVAYSTSRRDSYSDYDRYNRSNVQARSTRIQGYTNPRDVRAVRSNSDARTYQTRSTRVRSSSPVNRNSTYNRSRNNRVEGVRSSSQRRSNNSGNYSRSSNSSRSSGTYRSSSSSSRSSGTSRSSGSSSRSNRGRGN